MTGDPRTPNRLHVLVFPSRYPSPSQPGLATFHREHVRATMLFNDVVVLDHPREETPSLRRPFLVSRSVEDGVPIARVHYRRSPIPKTSLALHACAAVSAYRQIVRSGFRPDIIHAHMYFVSLAAVLLGKLFRVPVVVTEHSECYSIGFPSLIGRPTSRMIDFGTPGCYSIGFPSLIGREVKLAMGLADRVVPVSESLKAQMESWGIRGRFRVIPNPVDVTTFHPSAPGGSRSARPRRVLYVGRLLSTKGIDVMLEGLAILARRRGDVLLDIVGDGAGRAEYESLARQLGLEVRFHGNQPRERVAEFMRAAEALLLPSRYENCPCVVIEALASGLPVVASDLGAVREIVPKDMGVFFPKEDPARLAEAVEQGLDNRDTYDPARLAAYARSRFGLAVIGRQVDDLYREVLAERA